MTFVYIHIYPPGCYVYENPATRNNGGLINLKDYQRATGALSPWEGGSGMST